MRGARFWLLPLPLLVLACTPSLQSVRDVSRSVWDAARLLCIVTRAEAAGVSVEEVRDTVCQTQDEISPYVEPLLRASYEPQTGGACE